MNTRNLKACWPPVAALGEGNWIEVAVVVATLGLGALLFVHPYDETSSLWIATMAIVALVAWIVVQDVRTFKIADGATVSLATLAIASRWAAGDSALAMLMDGLLTGGILFLFREIYFRRRGIDGLGLGDVKLAAAGGLLVGAATFAWVLCAASLVGLCIVAARRLVLAGDSRRLEAEEPERLAFGALLAPAILAAWVASCLPILLPSAGF